MVGQMKVKLAVTHTCHHCPIIEKELKQRDIPYEVLYVEEHPDIVQRFGLKRSPNLIADEKLIFNGMPELAELRRFLDGLKAGASE